MEEVVKEKRNTSNSAQTCPGYCKKDEDKGSSSKRWIPIPDIYEIYHLTHKLANQMKLRAYKSAMGNKMTNIPRIWAAIAIAALLTTGCGTMQQHNLPPADQIAHPGPGVDGPGPGVLMPQQHPVAMMMPQAAAPGGSSIQAIFNNPDGMQIDLDTQLNGSYAGQTLITPARHDFQVGINGSMMRMKLSSIPGHEAVELFPTIEVAPINPRTAAYLDHNAVPIQFTNEDFDQVATGNYVTKVIYLPDPEFQDLALANVETLVSTRLDPGDDPIVEADRRGSIMAIIRMGNKVQSPMAAPAASPAAYYPRMMPQQAMMGMPGGHVSGVTAPQWGMPMTATNLGIPGPPHLPLGGPAGLQNYTIHNHTKVNMPAPVNDFDVHLRQVPGYSYPKPVSEVRIREHSYTPTARNFQPAGVRNQLIP